MTIRFRGKIAYRSKKPERMDQERGREDFFITEHENGTLVLHSHSEIDDAPSVVRDVMLAFDKKTGKPYQCSKRLTVGGKFEGSGFMYFTDTEAVCHTFNQRDGIIHQTIPLKEPIIWLVAHQIIGDGMLAITFTKGPSPASKNYRPSCLPRPTTVGRQGQCSSRLTLAYA